ncbi:MAG: ABC transporter permease [Streptosporangiaceae bacterium]
MSPGQIFRFALAGLAANKLRSALTTLGILIGVGSVILLVAVGNGSSQSVQNAISSLGASAITVLHTNGSAGPAAAPTSAATGSTAFAEPQNLTVQDAQALAQAQEVTSASPVVSTSETLDNGATSDSGVSLTGTYPSYFPAENDTLSKGSYFTTQEVNTARDVVVLGSEAATDLFGTANPVGQSVLVAGIPFTVTGVLATKGASGLTSADNMAIAPLTTVQDALTGFGTLNNVVVLAKSASQVSTVEGEIASILDLRHHESAADADFDVLNASTLLSTASSTAHTFTVLLGAVAAISLLVGGIGITNIMLVTVTERTREIGIRKAIGATPGVILAQFLTEATLLSMIGGALGVLGGVVGTRFMIVGVKPVIVPFSIPLAFGVSALIGLFFGGFPANRAANMRPADALRYE